MYRWLCRSKIEDFRDHERFHLSNHHTAVTPILAVRTRSYLLTHIFRPVTISIRYQFTRRTDVQATFNTVRLRVIATRRTRLRGVPLVLFQHLDATNLALVCKILVDAVERPRMEFLVASLSPVGLSHVFGPTHRERSYVSLDTLRNDGVSQRVVKVRLAVSEFSTCPHRLLRGAILTLSVLLGSLEVVFVLLE